MSDQDAVAVPERVLVAGRRGTGSNRLPDPLADEHELFTRAR